MICMYLVDCNLPCAAATVTTACITPPLLANDATDAREEAKKEAEKEAPLAMDFGCGYDSSKNDIEMIIHVKGGR